MKMLSLIFVFLFICIGFSSAFAQDDMMPPKEFKEARRPNLLRELNLTPEQVEQIRQINLVNKEKVREAQIRAREATKNLDQAIYADVQDENVINERVRQLQAAQAELTKLRAATEFAVRKILTPEQLTRFRELRQQFMQMRNNRQNNRFERQNRRRNLPERNLNNRQMPPNQ